MISMRTTGGPEDFSGRLGVSKRTLFYYLSLLKELGAPIRYSSSIDSYEYGEDGRISMEYKKKQTA